VFRIAEFARLGGVTAKTLRAWDDAGVFRPAWVDPSTGYRSYSPAQLPELRRILALRDVGVPLAELSDLVAGGADLRAVLARRRAGLEHERRELERRLRVLDITVAMADPVPGRAEDAIPDVVVRSVIEEPAATMTLDPGEERDLGPAFYAVEAHVRDHGRRAPRPPGVIEVADPPGRGILVFVPVRGPVEPAGRIAFRRLPACRVASIIHRGTYEGLAGAGAALQRWVSAAGHSRAGPLRVLYLQFGAEPELRVPQAFVVDRAIDYVTELQQPLG
jgi:DNA-binding transcriptional MerR regulator